MALAGLPAAEAATYVVDDSSTLPFETQIPGRWRNTLGPNRQMSNEIEGSATVNVRLDLAPWQSRNGRIYLALPQQPIGVVDVEWATQGRLLPGQLRSGERTLVYAGPIRTSYLEDTLVVRVVADGRRVVSTQRLQFHFEIDVD